MIATDNMHTMCNKSGTFYVSLSYKFPWDRQRDTEQCIMQPSEGTATLFIHHSCLLWNQHEITE